LQSATLDEIIGIIEHLTTESRASPAARLLESGLISQEPKKSVSEIQTLSLKDETAAMISDFKARLIAAHEKRNFPHETNKEGKTKVLSKTSNIKIFQLQSHNASM
jgi:hypothetical protein